MPATKDCFDAIQASLRKSIEALDRRRVPFLLGGSLAVWARGGPESCNDLDLMVQPRDAEAALEALEQGGMRGERPPEGWLFKAWDGDVLVDLIFAPKGLGLAEAVFEGSGAGGGFGLRLRGVTPGGGLHP